MSISFDSYVWQTALDIAPTEGSIEKQATIFPKCLQNEFYLSGKLSIREREVAHLVAKEYSSKQIAHLLCISMYTVNTYRKK